MNRLTSRLADRPRGAARRAREGVRRLITSDVVRRGAPGVAVAVLAAIALGVILVTVQHESKQRSAQALHAVAQVWANRFGCAIEPGVRTNAMSCAVTGRRTIAVTFRDPLVGRTAFVTAHECCRGAVSAAIVAPRVVVVAFSRLTRHGQRASIFIP